MLTDEIKAEIESHADEFPTIEVCGFVLKTGEVVRSENQSTDPENSAVTDPDLFLEHQDNIAAIYHSHCKIEHAGYLSFHDIVQSKFFNLPYILFHTIDRSWDLYDPNDLNPWPLQERNGTPQSADFYIGWAWDWGRADCYTLLRNWMKGHGICEMDEFERSPNPEEYLTEGWSRYEDGLPTQGFVRLAPGTPLQKHDVVLMAIKSDTPHHAGVITHVARGGEQIQFIHHLGPTRLSKEVVYGGYWKDSTRSVWRFESA
jgi:proteasome lid subunit RPN8/RPN11